MLSYKQAEQLQAESKQWIEWAYKNVSITTKQNKKNNYIVK